MAHGDAREGKQKGNWRMEWVASTLHSTSEHGVSSISTADAHTSAASSQQNWRPRRFNWTPPFCQKMKLVSAHVPSHFKRSLRLYHLQTMTVHFCKGVFNYLNTKKVQCKHTIIREYSLVIRSWNVKVKVHKSVLFPSKVVFCCNNSQKPLRAVGGCQR